MKSTHKILQIFMFASGSKAGSKDIGCGKVDGSVKHFPFFFSKWAKHPEILNVLNDFF